MDKVMPTARTSDRKPNIYTYGVSSAGRPRKPAHSGTFTFDEQLKRVIDKHRDAVNSQNKR